jgi:antibiotic biosynthesis monooxygenase (ABM) superfamily enzyme
MPPVKTGAMYYEIDITRSESIHTAVIRSRVRPEELSQFVPAACGEVWSFILSSYPGYLVAVLGCTGAGVAWCFALDASGRGH